MNEFDDLTDAAMADPPLAPPSMVNVAERVVRRRRRRIGARLAVSGVAMALVVAGVVAFWPDGDDPVDVRVADEDAEPDGEAQESPPDDANSLSDPQVTSPNPVVIQPDPQPGEPCSAGAGFTPGADQAAAATGAFDGWLNTLPRGEAGPYIQDWDEISESVLAAAEQAPLPLDLYRGEVHDLFLANDDLICVMYTISNDGTPVLDAAGEAVLVDGEWKVSRDTVCEALRSGTVRCPGDEVVVNSQESPGAEILVSSSLLFDTSSAWVGSRISFHFDPALIEGDVMGDDVVMRLVDDPSVVVQHSGVFTDDPNATLASSGTEDDAWPVSGAGSLQIPSAAAVGRYRVEFIDHPQLNGELEVQSWGIGVGVNVDSLFASARLFVAGEFGDTPRREVRLGGTTRWAYSFEIETVPWFGTEAAPYDPDAADTIEIVVDADLAERIDREFETGRQWVLALGGVDTDEGLMAATVFGPAGVFSVADDGSLTALDSRIGTLSADEFAGRIGEL